ncbi:MAG: 2-hydroxyacyl-CoA dehydratase family protein [Candidatus Bathyarchaeota archaeon]|nr:2-hydroxyacyl-CoA dehydratase family protein [Candidatus Bathyarchaeota archaeon]
MSLQRKKSRVLQTTKKIGELIMAYFSQTSDAKAQGKPVAWVTVFTPVELLYAMDVYPIAPEHFGAMCSARGFILDYLQEAEREGYSQNLCSYSRCSLGYVLSGTSGLMPPPDILVTFRNSCDVYVKWWQSLHMHLGTPLFVGETPYVLTSEDLDNYVLDYVVKQLEQLVEMAEEKFGSRLDMEKLADIVRLSDKASELWLETLKLRRFRPCPLGGRDSASDIFPLVVMQGTTEAVEFYEELLEEVKQKVNMGEGVLENERFRLLFDGIWLWHAFDLIKYFEDRGAVFVYEPYSDAWAYRLDASKPLESIARKILAMGLNVDIDIRTERFSESIEEFQIDGAVLFSNRSCKTWSTPQLVTADILNKNFNVPYLLFEADMADPRQYAEAQIKNRIDAFLEVLGER